MSEEHLKIVVIATMLPGQIRRLIEEEGVAGRRVAAVGSSLIFFEKIESPVDAKMVSITLRRPAGIVRILQDEARIGWRLGAMGSNFAFFNRPRGQETPFEVEYRLESISALSPSRILARATELGEDSWRVDDLGTSYMALHRRGGDRNTYGYLLESITTMTPDSMRALLDERRGHGWQLSGISRSFVILSQEAGARVPAPATGSG